MLNLCHTRSFCSIFSDSTDKGGEGRAAIFAAMKVKEE